MVYFRKQASPPTEPNLTSGWAPDHIGAVRLLRAWSRQGPPSARPTSDPLVEGWNRLVDDLVATVR